MIFISRILRKIFPAPQVFTVYIVITVNTVYINKPNVK